MNLSGSFQVISPPTRGNKAQSVRIYLNVVLSCAQNRLIVHYLGHWSGSGAFYVPVGGKVVLDIPFNPGSTQLVCIPPIRQGAALDISGGL